MSFNIHNEVRKHLLAFLQKVVAGSYTQNESENFSMMTYQSPELEEVRVAVCDMIAQPPGKFDLAKRTLNEENRVIVEGVVSKLEMLCE